jgi:integrase
VRHIREWWDRTQDSQTDAQTRKAYRLLKAAFNRLVDDEEIAGNPCRIKGASSPVPARRRVASEDELEAILEHIHPRWHALILIGAWVGPRWGELRGMQRADIDLTTGSIIIDDQLDSRGVRRATKTHDVGSVHMPPHIIPIVRAHLAAWVGPEPDALLFTGVKGGPLSMSYFGKHWRAAQVAAGVDPPLQIHDLRRTAGTWATQKAGADLATVMRRLRHRNVTTAMGYQVPDQESDRAVAERLSASRAAAQ